MLSLSVNVHLLGVFMISRDALSDHFLPPTDYPCKCSGYQGCPDDKCPQGCEYGWSGQRCQLGNLAYGKKAEHSSTYLNNGDSYNASLSVDGRLPDPNDVSGTITQVYFCSQTRDDHPYTESDAWWYVDLGQSYVIVSVSITRRVSETQLKHFSILVGNRTSGNISETGWSLCQRQTSLPQDINTTHDCESFVIGQYVGILQTYDPTRGTNVVRLCEVWVYGYAWKAMPLITDEMLTISTGCDNTTVSLLPKVWNDELVPSRVDFNWTEKGAINSNATQLNYSTNVSYSFGLTAGRSYTLKMAPLVCNNSSFCRPGQSLERTLDTGFRFASATADGKCVSIKINSSSAGCFIPSSINVSCSSKDLPTLSSTDSKKVCNLTEEKEYICRIVAAVLGGYEEYNISGVQVQTAPQPASTNGALIGGVIGAFVAIGAISVGVLFLWRRHRKRPQKQHIVLDESGVNQAYTPPTEAKFATTDTLNAELVYDNLSGMTLNEFRSYVNQEAFISTKFAELSECEGGSCQVGMKLENKSRNRFQNIVPYDVNRIVLSSAPDNTDGYVNASYIDGYSQVRQYIAAQGPTAKTTADFWRMVWQEDVSVIIMLTSFFENGKKKCEEYFPFGSSPMCDIEVSVVSSNEYDGYKISELVLNKGDLRKSVTHCHYLSWHDHSVPESMAHFAIFRARANRLNSSTQRKSGSKLVHCSAGAGRTGSYIAIENAMNRFNKDGCVDIDRCVLGIRQQRMHMVQTKEQYIFIHQAVLYEMLTQRFAIARKDPVFNGHMPTQSTEVSHADEWRVLQDVAPKWDSSNYEAALKHGNLAKNRSPFVLASDKCRALLRDISAGTDAYINAVFCRGWYCKNAFLATQLPLPSTCVDYWNLIYETEPSCIIVLDGVKQDESCVQYLPADRASSDVLFSPFSIKSSENEQANEYFTTQHVVIAMQANKQQTTHRVTIFKLTSEAWSEAGEVPKAPLAFIRLSDSVRLLRRSHPDKPIVVQCLDGATRCGLCLAAFNCLDRLAEDDEINAIHAVDLLRTSQPKFITGKAQYECLLGILRAALSASTSSSDVYENISIKA